MATTTTRKKSTRRPVKTEAQKAEAREAAQAKAKEAHDRLALQVETLSTSEGWKAYLTTASRFRSYSFNNLMMIAAQMPEATKVAGFRKWQEMGRTVRKGEKAIRIFGFSKKTELDEVTGKEVERVYYPLLSVFDISQTDVVDAELWGQHSVTNPLSLENLTGEDEQGMGDALEAYLGTLGWTVAEEDLTGGLEGYADPRRKHVAYRVGTAPAERASTLAHEVAHIVDGHTESGDYAAHRGRCEAIAESTAYLVADAFGIPADRYSVGYVTTWAKGDTKMVRDIAETTLATFRKIMDGLEALVPAE